jgi:regulator of replication initiation timing
LRDGNEWALFLDIKDSERSEISGEFVTSRSAVLLSRTVSLFLKGRPSTSVWADLMHFMIDMKMTTQAVSDARFSHQLATAQRITNLLTPSKARPGRSLQSTKLEELEDGVTRKEEGQDGKIALLESEVKDLKDKCVSASAENTELTKQVASLRKTLDKLRIVLMEEEMDSGEKAKAMEVKKEGKAMETQGKSGRVDHQLRRPFIMLDEGIGLKDKSR